MQYTTAGLLLLSVLALLAGCSSRPAYYVAPPPPPVAYAEPPLIQTARQNGLSMAAKTASGIACRANSYRPTYSHRYANTPGYDSQLGSAFRQYQSAYRDAYVRGYHKGYERG